MKKENVSSSMSEIPFNVSDAELKAFYSELIARLNHERMLFQLPVIVVLLLVMVVAILGNILVILVYRMSYRNRVSSFFITLLAVVDMATALCIPFNIQDMFHPYTNSLPVVCKIGRFLESFLSVLSGNLLVCVAFDRYFHIIYPLRRYTFQQAKSLVIVVTAIALCISWPQLLLAGKRTVETSIEGVYGEDCSFRDEVKDSIYELLFHGTLMLAFVTGFGIFVIFYGRIYYVIWRRHKTVIGEQISSMSRGKLRQFKESLELRNSVDSNCNTRTEIQSQEDELTATETEICDKNDEMQTVDIKADEENDAKMNRKIKTKNPRSGTSRTTRIMTIVTVFGTVGYLPYLTVNILKTMGLYFQPGMSESEDLVYEFCTKSHFMNSFVNPIIYSVMNPIFRSNALKTIKKTGKLCCVKKKYIV